eukprot:Unigene3696_Nuclearia_a/m.11283 Unigene3696_Nuclearia_a/g.11283  ORF Unigene3696_Nuclearia_a/g.11283 Unigene3696_Nuclearia_a/m.11283 type:complete len:177 (+) Unigene3696_Nuclearia_a:136-666(+)
MADDTAAPELAWATPSNPAKAGPAAPLAPAHETVVADVLALYQGKFSEAAMRHYTDDAVFEDPVSICKGFENVGAAWVGLAKVFSRSVTRSAVSTYHPATQRIHVQMEQEYTVRGINYTFVMPSLAVLYMRGDRVYRHEDLWYSKPLSHGFLSTTLRGLSGATMGLFFAPRISAPA